MFHSASKRLPIPQIFLSNGQSFVKPHLYAQQLCKKCCRLLGQRLRMSSARRKLRADDTASSWAAPRCTLPI